MILVWIARVWGAGLVLVADVFTLKSHYVNRSLVSPCF